ncbi:MAG: hypothetical protein WCY58_02080 [Mariniphaga sp.]|nr:hypothetical protein [Mariniphaga sp.]MDD4227420.1 hypothetical protein [Mariniphaga sp.]MDD4425470.1 hypothetical protein [Mariniphaga sp.]
MKLLATAFTFIVLSIAVITSCEEANEPNPNPLFRIEFSDGTQITENNISYYDSSAHLLFLKMDFELDQSFSGFTVFVGNDTVFSGVIHLCLWSSMPKTPHFMTDCFHYGYNILEMGFYGNTNDLRNDPRIINALKSRSLLRNGISCTMDTIEITALENSSRVACTITLENQDDIGYYVLDPAKMGDLHFNYFTGGVTLRNSETKVSYPLRWSVPYVEWDNLSMDHFYLLQKNSKVTFTFQSSDYHRMEPGSYSTWFSFCGPRHNIPEFNLNQPDGRIWVGTILLTLNDVIVK